jgi:hypothetical protein
MIKRLIWLQRTLKKEKKLQSERLLTGDRRRTSNKSLLVKNDERSAMNNDSVSENLRSLANEPLHVRDKLDRTVNNHDRRGDADKFVQLNDEVNRIVCN